MKKIKYDLLNTLKLLILSLLLATGVNYLFAWTGPTTTPPGSNASAPINASFNSQSKLGQLFINTSTTSPYSIGFSAFGESVFTSNSLGVTPALQINDGTAGVGKILTSTDASGTAQWQTATSSKTNIATFDYYNGVSSVGVISSSTNGQYTWTVPSGVTSILVETIGGGGGGANTDGGAGCYGGGCGGGGGGGGGYAMSTLSVTPGTTYDIVVGGGAGAVGNCVTTTPGSYGGYSAFETTGATILVEGNGGGSAYHGSYASCSTGGPGGSGTGSLVVAGIPGNNGATGGHSTAGSLFQCTNAMGGYSFQGIYNNPVIIAAGCASSNQSSQPGTGGIGQNWNGNSGQVTIRW